MCVLAKAFKWSVELQGHSGMLQRARQCCHHISLQHAAACDQTSEPDLPLILTGTAVIQEVYCVDGRSVCSLQN